MSQYFYSLVAEMFILTSNSSLSLSEGEAAGLSQIGQAVVDVIWTLWLL